MTETRLRLCRLVAPKCACCANVASGGVGRGPGSGRRKRATGRRMRNGAQQAQPANGGSDGTRTRDLRLDRPARVTTKSWNRRRLRQSAGATMSPTMLRSLRVLAPIAPNARPGRAWTRPRVPWSPARSALLGDQPPTRPRRRRTGSKAASPRSATPLSPNPAGSASPPSSGASCPGNARGSSSLRLSLALRPDTGKANFSTGFTAVPVKCLRSSTPWPHLVNVIVALRGASQRAPLEHRHLAGNSSIVRRSYTTVAEGWSQHLWSMSCRGQGKAVHLEPESRHDRTQQPEPRSERCPASSD